MITTRRAAILVAALLVVAAAVFLFPRGGSDAPQFAITTTTTAKAAAATTATLAEPDEPASATSAVTVTTAATVTEPGQPTTTTSTVTATTTATVAEPDEPAPTTTTTTTVPVVTVPMPDPVDWWVYDAELEWPVTDRDRLSTTELVYPRDTISDAVQVAKRVEAFWSWYMTEGHPQGAALDLSGHDGLAGDAVGQLMFVHHRFWQQRLPVWRDVWNRDFAKAREAQRNKLIYLDSLGDLTRGALPAGPPTLLYNPAEETSVWRYWGPIIRPVPDPIAPRRTGELLPDDVGGACGPDSASPDDILEIVDWECVHLGPAEDAPALGDWDVSWYYDIPHEHAAWYVWTADGLVRYDPDTHGVPTSNHTVADGRLVYLPATVTGWADFTEALKPYRPEGFPDDPDAYRQMWRHDVGGNSSWHKEMGQLVLLVPAAEMVGWLEANGYDPQDMFAQGWPNPDEERLIRNTWAKDWDRDNPADWRNKFKDAVDWLEQGVEIGDSGNLAADIEAAIHISAWMDWAYRSRLDRAPFPDSQFSSWWSPSVVAPGLDYGASSQEMAEATFGHREDGWATEGGIWWGLYHQALADGYAPDARTGRLTHPALSPELAVWREWAAAGEAERWLGFQAADGDLGPAPGDTWIPWYPEHMVPLEGHYVLPEHAVGHWESVVDWWPDGGLEPPVHQPDWHHAFTVAGPYVADAGGHMFETCLWATGGLFAAWSLPHPELEDASQNVTWIVRGIADHQGRIVNLAEPVNRPCINASNPQQREGTVRLSYGGRPTFERYMEWLRTPIPDEHINRAYDRATGRWRGYDRATGLWTADSGNRVEVPSQLLEDGNISVHELMWLRSVVTAGPNPSRDGSDGVLKPSYEEWQQWEADALMRSRWVILTWSHEDWRQWAANAIEAARSDYRERGRLPLEHYGWIVMSDWETTRQQWAEYTAYAFNDLIGGAELDTPARYGDWLLGGPRSYPEEFIRSTYQLISDERLRQPRRYALAVQRRNRRRRERLGAAHIRMGQMARPQRSRNLAHRGADNPPVRPTLGNGPDHPRRPHRQRIRRQQGRSQRLVMGIRRNAHRLPRRCPMDRVPHQLPRRRVPRPDHREQLATRRRGHRVRSRSVRHPRMGLARAAVRPLRQQPRIPCTGRLAAVDLGEPSQQQPGLATRQQAATRRLRRNSRRPLHPRLHLPSPRHRGLSRLDARPRTQTPRSLVRHRKPLRRIASTAQAATPSLGYMAHHAVQGDSVQVVGLDLRKPVRCVTDVE